MGCLNLFLQCVDYVFPCSLFSIFYIQHKNKTLTNTIKSEKPVPSRPE